MIKKHHIVITSLVVIGFTIYFILLISADKIHKGIFIDNIYVGKMRKDEAISELYQIFREKYSNARVIIFYREEEWPIPLSNISFRTNIEKSVEKAYNICRSGGIIERVTDFYHLFKKPQRINSEPLYDTEKLEKILESIAAQVNLEPVNAKVMYIDNQIKVLPHRNGRLVDVHGTKKLIEEKLYLKDFTRVPLVVSSIPAVIQTKMLDKISDFFSSYSTVFNVKYASRADNIRLACSKLNNIVLLPGEIFSMDAALGPRTEENGYRNAKIILNNELVDGVGGGICQVTSTIYNAVLLSGLEIVERKNHSLPLSYVGLGRDATIADGYIDFKFRNNLDYAIMIVTKVKDNKITISIMGKKPEKIRKYKIRTMVLEEIKPKSIDIVLDPDLKGDEVRIDKKASSGYRVVVFRDVYDENGRRIKVEKISEDYYKPQNERIAISYDYKMKINSINKKIRIKK